MVRSTVMALIVVLGCAALPRSGAHAQAPGASSTPRGNASIPPDGATLTTLPAGAWAMTVCRTRPITWFSQEMPEHAKGMVEAHEAEHRRHMSSFATCEEFWAWRRADPEHEIIAEARGFCAGAKYELDRGAHPSFLAAARAQALVFENYHVWQLEDALGAIIRNCNPSRTLGSPPRPEPRRLPGSPLGG